MKVLLSAANHPQKVKRMACLLAGFFCVHFFTIGLSFAQFNPANQIDPAPSPRSFNLSLKTPAAVTLAPVDNADYIAEDNQMYEDAKLNGELPSFRIAHPQEVSMNLNSSGAWETLANGDRIWRLRIVSRGATDLYLQYDQWRIIKPCELYLYNDDRSMVLGPYTSADNWDGTNITPLTKGDAVTLEYFVPAGVKDFGELSIMRIGHGYRHFLDRTEYRDSDQLDAFGDAMWCMININCFPSMQEEKRAVAMIIDPMGGACSGTMLNNTLQNGDPLFLTANHCLTGNQSNWLFYFNYESPNCSPNQDGDLQYVISNASLLMSHALTDHALLRLSRPRPNRPYIPAYMGWYRPDIAASSSYGVHHPQADVKKGHEDYNPATSTDWNGVGPNTHWLTHIDNGMMEPGSSGSPMINTGGYVVGPLHGGSWDCDGGTVNDAKYGKLSIAWEGDGTSSGRLRDWLDPNNSGAISAGYWQPFGPPNDSCGQPGSATITTLPYSQSGSTQFASNNFNTLGGCNTNTSPELVYMMQLPCDHSVTVSTCGSGFDTQLFVFGASSCMSWSWLEECNDDFCGAGSQVTFDAVGGQLYVIVLEGYGSSWGNYVLNITGTATGAQGNAQCPGYQITEVPYFTYGANYCGGDDLNPTCQSNDAQDVHWYWVSPYNQAMRAKTCYINFDTILEVRYGGACPGDWLAGCNDDYFCGSDATASTVVFGAYAGGTYYITMDGYNGAEGIASLELEVYNDNCSSPIVVPSLPANYQGDTRPARDDYATVVGPNSKEVFFQYTSPTCQTVGVSLCDENYTNYDTGLEVRTGGGCPGSTLVAYNDDACGADNRKSWLTFSAEANRTYYIIIGGYDTNAGQFMAYFYNIPGAPTAPLADVCPGIQIPSLPFTDYGNTCCMTRNYADCAYGTAPEMVYQFMLPTCQQVTASLCGSGYDTGLGVYGGVCPNIAPLIVCSDDNYCGDVWSLQGTVTFIAEANTNYQILVHGFDTNCGNYVINVSGVPCPLTSPDPIVDLVIELDHSTESAILHWSPAAGAEIYHVNGSANQDDVFAPANELVAVTDTFYVCSGCLTTNPDPYFFGVTAENTVALATMDADQNAEIDKSAAANSPVIENPAFYMTNEIDEQASPDK